MRFNDYGKGAWGNETHKIERTSRFSSKWTSKSELDKKSIKDENTGMSIWKGKVGNNFKFGKNEF